jgi:cobalt-zinc-cadmium efflux system protein
MSQPLPHKKYGRAFALGISLNVIYIIVEVVYGLSSGSSALLADAGHNASDVLSLALAWAALWLAGRKPSGRYTYGLRKSTIMASLINGVLIIVAAGIIAWDAFHKITDPVPIPGNVIMWVAGIGILINTGTALLFVKDQKDDLNIKGAFLHMAADAGVSAGVVLGGLGIKLTGAQWIDPALSFLIVIVIVYSTWGLLSNSVELALDKVPEGIDMKAVEAYLEKLPGVADVHHIHIWALSTTETALTAHLVVPDGHDDKFIHDTREVLSEKFNIGHATLQIEKELPENINGQYVERRN